MVQFCVYGYALGCVVVGDGACVVDGAVVVVNGVVCGVVVAGAYSDAIVLLMAARRDKLYQCDNKTQYESWLRAKRAARNAMRYAKAYLQPYLCRYCHHWHIGHALGSRHL